METILVAVTLVSIALASTMGVLTWRVVALDRRREAARAAALAALAAEEDDLPLAPAGPERPGAPAAAHYADNRRTTEYAESADQRPTAEYAEHADRRGAQPAIFSQAERESPAGRRLVAVAAVAALMAVAVGTLVFAGRSLDSPASNVAATSAASRTAAPLELVSLRHERAGDRLTITGLVRNPRDGARVERANAVAFVFHPNGTFVASGRALVDFVTLDPGDESPFVVSVTAPGPIGRYRVGFRGQDGAVVGHVDRRSAI
jgi:hypothetical protein